MFEINLLTSLQYNDISKEIGYYSGVSEQKPTFYYLQAETVNGKDCYAIGKNRYVRANNVDSIDGYPHIYYGVTYATVLKKTTTQTLTNDSTKHVLKKGQKIKIYLAVDPEIEDFKGYIYRLCDYPNEYVAQSYIKLRNYLPTSSYGDLTFTFVKLQTTADTEFYNLDGTPTGISYRNSNQTPLTTDGLYYLWVPSENKAELFYQKVATDKDKQELQRKFEAKKNAQNVKGHDESAVKNYNNALLIASSVLQSPKATIAQVKQALWLLEPIRTQLAL